MGFSLSGWDYLTFAVLLMLIVAAGIVVVWIAGLPGRIAIAREHPDAEAVKLMGWAGLLAAVPWIQAFIWAFKPTDIVDIRRFPAEEREEIRKAIARLRANGGDKHKRKRRKIEPPPEQPPAALAGNGHDKPEPP